MKRLLTLFVVAIVVATQLLAREYRSYEGDALQARIYQLDNGLTVYLSQNKEKPEIQTMIAVRAGSKNDPAESTGLAHYLEHIMFKGTQSYGTTDYEKELPYLQAIDSLYEVHGKTTDQEERKAIYHQIDSVSYLSSQIAIANEFDKMMNILGASGVNAFTSTDYTCYIEAIPSSELRRWAMIESDRFQHLVIRGFHTELEAVYEEFNLNSTNDSRKVLLATDQALYANIPYRQQTTIGTQEHLKNPSIKNIRKFYNNYYCPNNVAIVMSGDLEFEHTMDIIEQYFGLWQPNEDKPAFIRPEYQPLKVHKDTIVNGNESPAIWLAWNVGDIHQEDHDAVQMMTHILQNGKCGLLDIDVAQRQLLLAADQFLYDQGDYSTFFLIGMPKEKQTLQDVRNILLQEIEKLKRGEFSEELLQAIINNHKRDEIIGLQSNYNRVDKMADSFLYGIDYADVVDELNRLSKVTKNDIVNAANKYLTDSYVCVEKRQSTIDANPQKVDKPQITPIEMNREAQSDFCTNLLTIEPEAILPQFLDFKKDLSVSTLDKNIRLLYRQNTEDELSSLSFVIKRGSSQDSYLDLSVELLDYLGTSDKSAEEYQSELYALASESFVNVYSNQTKISIVSLNETLLPALQLTEQHILSAQPDKLILNELIRDNIQAHKDMKSDQRTCFSQLTQYGMYGKSAMKQTTLTPRQMKRVKAQKALDNLRDLLPAIEQIEYYGPLSEQEVKQMLKDSKLLVGVEPTTRVEPERIKQEVVKQKEVWIAPFDANNTYMVAYANWGEVYTPKDEAIIRLFNEYFDGSMGSIVFQEMRESRALCYASSANYAKPSYKGDNNVFFTYIITQNDKLNDCILTFDSICNTLPLSPSAFENAKSSLLKSIEKRRYVRSQPISSYLRYTQLGWDHDYNEDVYREAKQLTLDDVVSFQKEHVANRTYRYLILGKQKELDMRFLKSQGKVKKLKLKDIFIY